MTESNNSHSGLQAAADDALRMCRVCKTAFSGAFPRLDCQCGQNDDGMADKNPVPPPDAGLPDPFGYGFKHPPYPSPEPPTTRTVPQDDPKAWWL